MSDERVINIIPASGFWILRYHEESKRRRWSRHRVAAWAIVQDDDGISARAMEAQFTGYLAIADDGERCVMHDVLADGEFDPCERSEGCFDDPALCGYCGGVVA